jgi:hypothetical protein
VPKAGARHGGHILVDRDKCGSRDNNVKISFETQSLGGAEQLTVDALDADQGEWKQLAVLEETKLGNGWTRVVAEGSFAAVDKATVQRLVLAAKRQHLKPVEITGVKVVTKNGPVAVIKENDPFSVEVSLRHNRAVPSVNVNLDITRSDGFYAFFQPSCFEHSISNHTGTSRIVFDFDPNPFGAGTYEISIAATNAYTLETAPPDDIYDRAMSVLKLEIHMARPIMYGAVNVPAKTRVDLSTEQGMS